MDILLIAGLWLPNSAWSEVAQRLERLGHNVVSLGLPGVDDESPDARLEDQLAAVVTAVDEADRPVLVGHSAACTLAWMAADRRPDALSKLLLVGGFPSTDGQKYADFFPIVDGAMPFPGWGPFEGPDSNDLSGGELERIAATAVPVPEGVAKGVVRLESEKRFDIPIVLVCPEYDPDQAKAWIDAGDVPEMSAANRVSFVDIDSGHWPMVSQPAELARIIDESTHDN